MTGRDPASEAKRCAAELTHVEQGIQERSALITDIERELATLLADTAGRRWHGGETERRKELEAERHMLEYGVLRTAGLPVRDGVCRLQPFMGLPGLRALRRKREQLLAEQAEWQSLIGVDMHAKSIRARLTRPGAYIDGRELRVGDIVMLTRAQFKAFGDKFERVEEQSNAVAGANTGTRSAAT